MAVQSSDLDSSSSYSSSQQKEEKEVNKNTNKNKVNNNEICRVITLPIVSPPFSKLCLLPLKLKKLLLHH